MQATPAQRVNDDVVASTAAIPHLALLCSVASAAAHNQCNCTLHSAAVVLLLVLLGVLLPSGQQHHTEQPAQQQQQAVIITPLLASMHACLLQAADSLLQTVSWLVL